VPLYLSIYLSIYLNIYIYVYICIHICIYVYIYIYLDIYVDMCIYIQKNVAASTGGAEVVPPRPFDAVVCHPTPYTLHPTPYTLHPTPYTLHPTPFTLHPTTGTPCLPDQCCDAELFLIDEAHDLQRLKLHQLGQRSLRLEFRVYRITSFRVQGSWKNVAASSRGPL
jgi:hypothetical protein